MKKILCFGNPFVLEDSLAVELGKELLIKDCEFIICVTPNEVIQHTDFSFIMDVAEGIDKIKVIGIEDLQENKLFSLHDFDLGFFLQLMQQIGRIDEVKIIAIPIGYDKEKAKKEIKKLI